MKLLFILLAILFASDKCYSADRGDIPIHWSSEVGRVLTATLVSGHPFTAFEARAHFQSLLDRNRAARSFVKVALFSSKRDAERYRRGKPTDVRSYKEWAELLDNEPLPEGDTALLVSTPYGTILRYRARTGAVQQEMSHPKRGSKQPLSFTVVDIHIGEQAPLLHARRVTVFLKADGNYPVSLWREFAVQLRDSMRVKFVEINVRPDTMFIYSPFFPLRDPFETGSRHTEEFFLRATTLICTVDRLESSCVEFPMQ